MFIKPRMDEYFFIFPRGREWYDGDTHRNPIKIRKWNFRWGNMTVGWYCHNIFHHSRLTHQLLANILWIVGEVMKNVVEQEGVLSFECHSLRSFCAGNFFKLYPTLTEMLEVSKHSGLLNQRLESSILPLIASEEKWKFFHVILLLPGK